MKYSRPNSASGTCTFVALSRAIRINIKKKNAAPRFFLVLNQHLKSKKAFEISL